MKKKKHLCIRKYLFRYGKFFSYKNHTLSEFLSKFYEYSQFAFSDVAELATKISNTFMKSLEYQQCLIPESFN